MDENVKEVGKELGKEVLDAVVEEAKKELNFNYQELHDEKTKEMREKYADVINDLSVKYGVDVGVAWNYFEAILRAELGNYAPEYSTEIEYDLVEGIRDYAELLYYSHKCNILG